MDDPREVSKLMRAAGSEAARQYEEMAGFPGTKYISTLGRLLVSGADALDAVLRERDECAREIMRLPEPPPDVGDGPQERVEYALKLLLSRQGP
jgi:hypothetical protein